MDHGDAGGAGGVHQAHDVRQGDALCLLGELAQHRVLADHPVLALGGDERGVTWVHQLREVERHGRGR